MYKGEKTHLDWIFHLDSPLFQLLPWEVCPSPIFEWKFHVAYRQPVQFVALGSFTLLSCLTFCLLFNCFEQDLNKNEIRFWGVIPELAPSHKNRGAGRYTK